MRKTDKHDMMFLRSNEKKPENQALLEPGNILVPKKPVMIGAVVASAVMVTMYDSFNKIGGVCHYLLSRPKQQESPTALFGLPALLKILEMFKSLGTKKEHLNVGLYGGAYPEWANGKQHEISKSNIEIAKEVMRRKNIVVKDEDIGGNRGRKIFYLSKTNEIAVFKTDNIRKSDWYPKVSEG